MAASHHIDIQGHVSQGFGPAREAFAENFTVLFVSSLIE